MEKLNENPIAPTQKATFIGAANYRRKMYGANHPLAIPRVSLTFDLVNSYGALTATEYKIARKAADHELLWFHTEEYVSAIKRAEVLGRVKNEYRQRYQLGTLENPYFEHFFTTPATATGASVQAAEEVLNGRIGFNPAGGMHHSRPGKAQGFCYFNDPVLGIMRLRQAGWRVLYVDIDAHHGDGVEEAFLHDPNVLTLSLHMDTAYAYPFSGGRLADCGTPESGYTSVNVPLPAGLNDAEYRAVFDAVWYPVVEKFSPDAIVLQAGTDMLAADPLGKFKLSTQCFLETARKIMTSAPTHADGTPKLLVTGGGGYHPLVLARAWTGLWAMLSGRRLPEAIPPSGTELLRSVEWDMDEEEDYYEHLFVSRLDELAEFPVRPEINELISLSSAHPFLTRQSVFASNF
jgi:acetoin utilization protein AcuC